jgi:hypothetical protein
MKMGTRRSQPQNSSHKTHRTCAEPGAVQSRALPGTRWPCRALLVSASACLAAFALALLPAVRTRAQSPAAAQPWHLPDIPWAFPIRATNPPVLDDRSGQLHVPGSSKTYTQEQIDDLQNPPDWFPDEHTPMPRVVAHGAPGGVLGCASCHLASGLGHPESANLAGVSA